MTNKTTVDRNLLTNKSTELSPRLASGKVNPKEVIKHINASLESLPDSDRKYLSEIKRQLIFREFANSAIQQQSYRQPAGALDQTSEEFKRLDRAQTGIPIIDAAVTEMKETGLPHNRARLLLARHAIRTLNIDPEVVSL